MGNLPEQWIFNIVIFNSGSKDYIHSSSYIYLIIMLTLHQSVQIQSAIMVNAIVMLLFMLNIQSFLGKTFASVAITLRLFF